MRTFKMELGKFMLNHEKNYCTPYFFEAIGCGEDDIDVSQKSKLEETLINRWNCVIRQKIDESNLVYMGRKRHMISVY